jgi:photosystem II oxygen-evolving enhancer protein 1
MKNRVFLATFLSLCLGVMTLFAGPAVAAFRDSNLTYDQIRGTGLANTCPQLEEASRGSIPLDQSKSYVLTDLCLQPLSFAVKEESTNKRQKAEFVAGKLMTRQTSSLEAVSGKLKLNADGSLTFKEEDGFDFQAITVQLPGGEQFPTLFTIKGLVASSQPGLDAVTTSTDFEGEFRVPSYRTANFLDPKGRGLTAGYESAVALYAQAGDEEELKRENLKQFQLSKGEISLQVAKVDSSTGEIGGTFESIQPSESDMGSREPTDVRIRGIFYARVQPAEA